MKDLRTVSLFSGIGGMDIGFINNGFEIIWANDFDKDAVKTYKANINDEIVFGDINDHLNEIPPHDVLLAGFPCQPFSMMGQKKGFEDERGTLFFTIEKILMTHKPKIIVLENVRNLQSHDNGRTLSRMLDILENKLNYKIHYKVLNTADFGLPQTRRRVFMVGFLKDDFKEKADKYEFPKAIKLNKTVFDLLDKEVDKKYFLSHKILPTIMSNGTKNYYSKSEINLPVAKPLTATIHKMHRANQDNYYEDLDNRAKFEDTKDRPISSVRRLTPNECRKLQGFPENWEYVVSDTQLYRQFGNAVSVNVSDSIAKSIKDVLGE
ncbi:DNA (cytosine-5-)-methyltransferase [Gracilibacillus oryzae]|uniref:Cytosine-specific methyltransferase n=1 Tax=Gracilibacillus oryzae TaxID=1672701 RepID=A0A7C8GQS6_9BACI|nr:DNA (cytosine-5-)-methyltransferase [Gracilibacillus oryzae]KAB8126061.1 DNA (cytosine-5-)-methyltransferase [Gracilibacillus oryzae]